MTNVIRLRRSKLALVLTASLLAILGSMLLAGVATGAGVPAPSEQAPAPQQVATVAKDLWAKAGTVTMPDTTVHDIWGFTDDELESAMLPGPVIEVQEGDEVTVTLHNELVGRNVSIVFPGQDLVPDYVGAAPGGTQTYTFIATKPGTYLYESGVNPQKQVQMGLYGTLIVRPSMGPGFAYNDAGTSFDQEAVLVLSEIDPGLHADPETYNLLDYNPQYFLINGKAFPDTDEIPAQPGERVLFRYLNAGALNHTMALLGLYQTVIAHDGFPLNFPYDTFSQTIVSGETYDLIATVPGDDDPGTQYPLYVRSRSMHTYTGDVFPGGMLTFITISGP